MIEVDEKGEASSGTILDVLRSHVENKGDSTAFTFLKSDGERVSITFRQLDLRAKSIARYLLGFAEIGDRALLMNPAGIEFIEAFLGCLYAGIVAVPAYPPKKNRNAERILSIAEDCKPRLLLCTTETRKSVESELSCAVLGSLLMATDSIPDLAGGTLPDVARDQLAFLQYTAGSTSAPKGVMVTHENIVANERLIQKYFEFSQQSVMISWLPMFHDMGLIGGILAPLFVGFPSVLMAPNTFLREPLMWLRAITEFNGTVTGAPNFAYDLCVKKISDAEKKGIDLSSLIVAYNGAEPVRGETLDRFSTAFAKCGFNKKAFFPCYGMAETTLLVSGGPPLSEKRTVVANSAALAQHRIEDADEGTRIVSCGQTGSDLEVRIVNPSTCAECRSNEIGEIWTHGKSVTSGYINQPAGTEASFQAKLIGDSRHWFRSGDYGFLRNGELYVTGRLKDLIIIRGRNIYPQDVEQLVENHLSFVQPNSCAAFSLEDGSEEKLLVVAEGTRDMVRWAKDHASFASELTKLRHAISELHSAVAEHFDVGLTEIVFVRPTSFPRTSSGKVQRSECRRLHQDKSLDAIELNRNWGKDDLPQQVKWNSRDHVIAYATVLTPFVLTIVAIFVATANEGLNIVLLAATFTMYLVSIVGIEVGFHRLFTHRSFDASRTFRFVLGVAGSLAAQGPILYWVAVHRQHHKYSDESGFDPHTPYKYGRSTLASRLRGLWYAHFGWMLIPHSIDYQKYCPDLLVDRDVRFLHRTYWLWIAVGIIAPGLFALAFAPSVLAFIYGCLWGGFVRVFLGHHAIWAVNSVCHSFGYRRFNTPDESRNHPLVAMVTIGGGWHNNHHAHPTSARTGMSWLEPDPGFWIINAARSLGFVGDIKRTLGSSNGKRPIAFTVGGIPRAGIASEITPEMDKFLDEFRIALSEGTTFRSDSIKSKTRLASLGLDSLQIAELCLTLEKQTASAISVDTFNRCETLSDLFDFLVPSERRVPASRLDNVPHVVVASSDACMDSCRDNDGNCISAQMDAVADSESQHDTQMPPHMIGPSLGKSTADFVGAVGTNLQVRCQPLSLWLNNRRTQGLFPYWRAMQSIPGKSVILGSEKGEDRKLFLNFASQDYLGLSQARDVVEAAKAAISEYGIHSAGSPALVGRTRPLINLELELAEVFSKEMCIIYPTGWAAGFGVLSGLVRSTDIILLDSLVHNCLYEGAKHTGARIKRFEHNQVEHLQARLTEIRKTEPSVAIFVVIESLYSMDSDSPDLNAFSRICQEFEAILILDVAHDFGSMGENGLGVWGTAQECNRPDIVMGSFSKTFASNGGFVAVDRTVADYLRIYSPSWVFSNALSPVQAQIALTCLRIVKSTEGVNRRTALIQVVEKLRCEMVSRGLSVAGIPSPIVPVFVGDEADARLTAKEISQRALAANLVEYPAVPVGSARFRFQVMSTHTSEQAEEAARIMSLSVEVARSGRRDVDSGSLK